MATTIKKPKNFKINLRSNKMIFAGIAVLSILVFLGALNLLKNLYQTETYYVLASDVPTRTQITPDMLEPVSASAGSAPKAAKTIGDVQSGYLYSKFPLLKGDILTDSNAGAFEDIATGVPDNWIVTNFSVPADNAVQGRIKRGTYFDMLVTSKEKGSYYPFVNILCLDTSISLGSASNANAVDTDEAKQGQTSQYTVGMSPEDAGKLHYLMEAGGGTVRLVLSPRQNGYAKPEIAAYTGLFKFSPDEDTPKDLGQGTDYTFTPVKRDAFGRPIENENKKCSEGNIQMTEEECKKAQAETENNSTASPTASSTSTPSDSATTTNDTTSPSATQTQR